MDYVGAGQANYQTQANALNQKDAAPQSASEAIISRLNAIRSYLAENRSSASHAAEKIVGTAPTPTTQPGLIKGERPAPHSFLDSLSQVIDDIEDIMRDTQEHLNRLHRSF